MTYAARYPAQVAGLVLLDSSSPHQFTDQPDFAGTYAMMRRLLPVVPALARVGALHLVPAVGVDRAVARAPRRRSRRSRPAPAAPATCATSKPQLRDVFAQAQALTTFDPKPLAVVTARENADGTTGWAAAQDRMAALSTNSTHWVADTTHVGLLDDAAGSTDSVRAITAVVTAVRTGSPLAPGDAHARRTHRPTRPAARRPEHRSSHAHRRHHTHQHRPSSDPAPHGDRTRHRSPQVVGRPRPRAHRADPGRPGHLRRQHRAAGHRRVAAPGQQRPAVAGHRLPAALRRRPAARRPHRRPAAPTPGVPHRHDHLHRRLPVQRVRRATPPSSSPPAPPRASAPP